MLQCYSVMARAFYRREKKGVCSVQMFHRLLLLCLSLSAYDCLKIAADGPSVFPFSKHPLFLFSKKPPSTNFGYYVPALLFSLPHPPTFRYYSFLFGEGGFKLDASDAADARAKTHTRVAYSNRLFWDKHEPDDWLSSIPHQ